MPSNNLRLSHLNLELNEIFKNFIAFQEEIQSIVFFCIYYLLYFQFKMKKCKSKQYLEDEFLLWVCRYTLDLWMCNGIVYILVICGANDRYQT